MEGIQGRKEHVLFENPLDIVLTAHAQTSRLAAFPIRCRHHQHAVHDAGFPGIGIAHQSDQRLPAPLTTSLLGLSDLGLFLQLMADVTDPLSNPALVNFQLLLAGAPGANAAARSGQSVAVAGQPRKPVAQLGQLHLKLAGSGLGPAGKNVQNQVRPVNDLQAYFRFQIPDLGPGQLIVEHNDIGLIRLRQLLHLQHLAAANIGGHINHPLVLDRGAHHLRIRGLHQLRQLVHGVLYIDPLAVVTYAHEDSALCHFPGGLVVRALFIVCRWLFSLKILGQWDHLRLHYIIRLGTVPRQNFGTQAVISL